MVQRKKYFFAVEPLAIHRELTHRHCIGGEMREKQLLLKIRQRDETALRELYHAYQPKLVRFLGRFTHSQQDYRRSHKRYPVSGVRE